MKAFLLKEIFISPMSFAETVDYLLHASSNGSVRLSPFNIN